MTVGARVGWINRGVWSNKRLRTRPKSAAPQADGTRATGASVGGRVPACSAASDALAVMVESGDRHPPRANFSILRRRLRRPAPETTRKFLEFIFVGKKVAGGKWASPNSSCWSN